MRSVSCSPREPEILLTFFTRLSSGFSYPPVGPRRRPAYACRMTLPAPTAAHVAVVTGASERHRERDRARPRPAAATSWCWWRGRHDQLEALADGCRPRRTSYPPTSPTPPRGPGCWPSSSHARPGRRVLVNNAGFSTLGPVAPQRPRGRAAAWSSVDVVAVVDLCSRFLPGHGASAGAGAVLNVASTAAFQPLPGQAAYGAAKAFVLSYTRSLAAELEGTGVTATVLARGRSTPVRRGGRLRPSEESEEALPPVDVGPGAATSRRPAVAGMDAGEARGHPGCRPTAPARRSPPDAQAGPAARVPRQGTTPGCAELTGRSRRRSGCDPAAAPERAGAAPRVQGGGTPAQPLVEHGGGPLALPGAGQRVDQGVLEHLALGGAAAERAGAREQPPRAGRRRRRSRPRPRPAARGTPGRRRRGRPGRRGPARWSAAPPARPRRPRRPGSSAACSAANGVGGVISQPSGAEPQTASLGRSPVQVPVTWQRHSSAPLSTSAREPVTSGGASSRS